MAKKSSYEKADLIFNEIINEPDIDGKIKELESKLEADNTIEKDEYIKDKILEKNANFSSKEEYEKTRKKLEAEYDKQENIKENEKKSLERKIRFYKGYIDNKDAIQNIRKLQFTLQKENERLELIQKRFDGIIDFMDDDEKIMLEREDIQNKLKDKNLNDDEKEKLKLQDEKLKNRIDKGNELAKNIYAMKKEDVIDVSDKIAKNKEIIKKCNIIWTSLLMGKDEKNIMEVLKKADVDKGNEDTYQIKDGNDFSESDGLENDIDVDQRTSDLNIEAENYGNNINVNVEPNRNVEQSLIPVRESFAERHPILSKIPLVGRIANYISKRINNEQDEQGRIDNQDIEDINDYSNRVENNNDRNILEELNKGIDQGRDIDNMLINIANNGTTYSYHKKSNIRDDVKIEEVVERYEKMKAKAEDPNRYTIDENGVKVDNFDRADDGDGR